MLPTHLKSVRGEIHKLQKQITRLNAIESERFGNDVLKKLNTDKKYKGETKMMFLNLIVDRPLIVQDGNKVRASWYKTHFKLSPF